MELVAPAGSLEKLKFALAFGADAVYIGLKNFSLRARADNFHDRDFEEIARLKGTKRLFGALNRFFHNEHISQLERELDYIAQYPLDGLIISDMGLVKILQKRFPGLPLHLSTQANCINGEAARLYKDLGFKRIVIGRECSLKEIEEIKNKVDIEIEVFVHGAMCLAYSGRCFLSAYMANRPANAGDCAHSCRWRYYLLQEEERPGQYFPVIEGEDYTTILSSKDLCMIDHLDRIKRAGADAVKIEGRMKSVYYTAVVTRAYRKALDNLDGRPVEDLRKYKDELLKVSHREFSTGFYFNNTEINTPTEKPYLSGGYRFLGTFANEERPGLYRLHVKNQIRTGETLEYIGPDVLYLEDSEYGLYDENFNAIDKIDHGKAAYLETALPVKPDYIIRQKQ